MNKHKCVHCDHIYDTGSSAWSFLPPCPKCKKVQTAGKEQP